MRRRGERAGKTAELFSSPFVNERKIKNDENFFPWVQKKEAKKNGIKKLGAFMLNLFFMLGLPEIFCCCLIGLSGWLAGAMIARNSPRLLSKIVISFLDLFFRKKEHIEFFYYLNVPPVHSSTTSRSFYVPPFTFSFFLAFNQSKNGKKSFLVIFFRSLLFHDVG